MHPPLKRPHPECEEIAEALARCHEENPLAKWVGACNAAKEAVNRCFKAEKANARRRNQRPKPLTERHLPGLPDPVGGPSPRSLPTGGAGGPDVAEKRP